MICFVDSDSTDLSARFLLPALNVGSVIGTHLKGNAAERQCRTYTGAARPQTLVPGQHSTPRAYLGLNYKDAMVKKQKTKGLLFGPHRV